MTCQKIKQKLNNAKLLGYKSIILEEDEVTPLQLTEIKDCGFIITKNQTEENIIYIIQE